MSSDDAMNKLERVRQSRLRPAKDVTLSFLVKQFERDVAKPFKQLGDLAELWTQLVPGKLVERTRLVGLSRGTLHVEVDNPAAHFELDRLLRSGLQNQLIRSHRGPAFRKVQVKLAGQSQSEKASPDRLPPPGDTHPHLDPAVQPPRSRDARTT